MARSGQKWPKVVKSGPKWQKMAKIGRKVARILRKFKEIQAFDWEKITEGCIKNAFIACGIMDKDGSYDV